MARANCLERVSKGWHREREHEQRLPASLLREVGAGSSGRPRLLGLELIKGMKKDAYRENSRDLLMAFLK